MDLKIFDFRIFFLMFGWIFVVVDRKRLSKFRFILSGSSGHCDNVC